MWDGRRPGDYVPLTAWEYICFIECERYTKFFQFERNAFHRYMQSLGYDVSLEKVMDGLKRKFIIVVVHGRGKMFIMITLKKDSEIKIGALIISHEKMRGMMTSDSFVNHLIYRFYYRRLTALPNYGLVQGREMIKMICRCAFNDSSLTDNESIVIMETCLDPRLDNILLEVNFNEGWKD